MLDSLEIHVECSFTFEILERIRKRNEEVSDVKASIYNRKRVRIR